jgi:hypothetical protein
MPAKNPRVSVVLERPVYDALGLLARRDGTTLSTKARDLLSEALDNYEDVGLAQIASERDVDASPGLTREQVWGVARKKRGA